MSLAKREWVRACIVINFNSNAAAAARGCQFMYKFKTFRFLLISSWISPRFHQDFITFSPIIAHIVINNLVQVKPRGWVLLITSFGRIKLVI